MLYDGGEKMAMPSANQWPQISISQQHMEERRSLSTAASNGKAMEKSSPAQDLALKCPRCDSSNTKFCYYNNYSLSQPRHFCKACKRYWTRGGTLRNVPVGGGCRKNKRIKRPNATADPPPSLPPPPSRPKIGVSTASNDVDRLIYGLPGAQSDINIAFPHLGSRLALSHLDTDKVPASCTAYNLQQQQQPSQLNSMWLSFPSATGTGNAVEEEYQARYNLNPIQDTVSSSPLLLPDYSFYGSSSSAQTSSSLEHQKLLLGLKEGPPANEFQAYLPYDDLQMAAKASGNSGILREVKMEQESNLMYNKLEWQVPCENPFETVSGANSTLYWNTDSSIYGSSSVAPLI